MTVSEEIKDLYSADSMAYYCDAVGQEFGDEIERRVILIANDNSDSHHIEFTVSIKSGDGWYDKSVCLGYETLLHAKLGGREWVSIEINKVVLAILATVTIGREAPTRPY